jgi:hypothetical protein
MDQVVPISDAGVIAVTLHDGNGFQVASASITQSDNEG